MLYYDFGAGVEALSTNRSDAVDFEVTLPVHQAHGSKVAEVPCPSERLHGVDALITDRPGVRIGVKTADCVPILLLDTRRRAVAAIHSGWRGTHADIIAATMAAMRQRYGTRGEDCRAVIGPCIHLDAFEVGDELHEVFETAGYGCHTARLPRFGTDNEDVKWHINLPGICRRQLARQGVTRVEVRPECTYTLHHLFFSARRLGPDFDRQRIINAIMLV